MILGLAIAVGISTAFVLPTATPDSDVRSLILSSAAEYAVAPPSTCGGFVKCGSTAHKIVPGEDDGSYMTHGCWGGTIHNGPACSQALVPLSSLLEVSPNEIVDLVADNPRVVANYDLQRIESLDCDGDHLLAAVGFELLGVTAEDLQ